jgi:hypothetical protein
MPVIFPAVMLPPVMFPPIVMSSCQNWRYGSRTDYSSRSTKRCNNCNCHKQCLLGLTVILKKIPNKMYKLIRVPKTVGEMKEILSLVCFCYFYFILCQTFLINALISQQLVQLEWLEQSLKGFIPSRHI